MAIEATEATEATEDMEDTADTDTDMANDLPSPSLQLVLNQILSLTMVTMDVDTMEDTEAMVAIMVMVATMGRIASQLF